MKFISYLKKIVKGQSLARISMNYGFANFSIRGKVVRVGGGRSPDYFDYFMKDNVVSISAIDGSFDKIDFEKDRLPYNDNYADTAICANVLEHIFNYDHLVSEIYRILKGGGEFVGFVPFLVNYHPDPNDYFRYTKEALLKIFIKGGFENIKIVAVGGSQLYVNFNNIMLSLPMVIKAFVWPFCYGLNYIYELFRPNIRERFPLGYIFYAKKHE